jgi:hypothetical protein
MREIFAAGLSRRSRAISDASAAFAFAGSMRSSLVIRMRSASATWRTDSMWFVERARAVHRVDRRHHRADAIEPGQRRIGQKRLDQRRRIGEPRGFDHHMIEARNDAVLALVIKIVERGDEIAEHGAAQAAVFQHHDGVVADCAASR